MILFDSTDVEMGLRNDLRIARRWGNIRMWKGNLYGKGKLLWVLAVKEWEMLIV